MYWAKKLFSFVLTSFLISVIAFAFLRILPSDPAYLIASIDEGSHFDQEVYEFIQTKYHFDKPLLQQYIYWVKGLFVGNWGISFYTGQKIFDQLFSSFGYSLQLVFLAWIFSLITGLFCGFFLVITNSNLIKFLISTFGFLGLAIPNFLMGVILVLIFGSILGWLPVAGYRDFFEGPMSWFKYMILPVLVLGSSYTAYIMQEIYSGLTEQLGKNYVQLARIKGINRIRVILKHCFPNVLIQLGALSSVQLSVLIGGTFIVEEIFVLPGLGRLMIESVKTNDYMVLQGGILIIAMFVLLLNTLVDFLFKYFDPRLRID